MERELKKVKYLKDKEGKFRVVELYDDDTIELVEIKKGIVDYIKNGK